PPSEEAMAFDIKTLKDMGCNMMRKHMKDEPARYYYLCDTMGLIVVQDMAAGGGDRNLRYGFYRREFKEMVDWLYNFPCIVMWVPFNENWGCQPGAFFTHNTLDWIRRYDPTRLVDGPSGWEDYEGGDLHRHVNGKLTLVRSGGAGHKPFPQCEAADAVDMHFYRGPGMPPVNPRRVSFLGEYGGLGQKVPGHVWFDNGQSWGYGGTGDTATKEGLTAVYLGLMDRLASLAFKGLGGAVYTQTSDVELEINGYLTYDRKVLKYDAAKLAAAHRKVLEMARLGAAHTSVTIPVFPKHDPDPKAWAYTTAEPAAAWTATDFDDAAWPRSAGGFGDKSIAVHAQAKVVTPWTTKTIWLRRHFNYAKEAKSLSAVFDMFHDEDVTIYLNGVELFRRTGFNQAYETFAIPGPAFDAAVRSGDNVLAVKVVQTAGGQYFDAGLSVERLEKATWGQTPD
ncbi:MAG: glycoside hydrolase family 2 TIM barrel-domain containing protein, partial [Kiritimatiellia bacterium]